MKAFLPLSLSLYKLSLFSSCFISMLVISKLYGFKIFVLNFGIGKQLAHPLDFPGATIFLVLSSVLIH